MRQPALAWGQQGCDPALHDDLGAGACASAPARIRSQRRMCRALRGHRVIACCSSAPWHGTDPQSSTRCRVVDAAPAGRCRQPRFRFCGPRPGPGCREAAVPGLPDPRSGRVPGRSAGPCPQPCSDRVRGRHACYVATIGGAGNSGQAHTHLCAIRAHNIQTAATTGRIPGSYCAKSRVCLFGREQPESAAGQHPVRPNLEDQSLGTTK